MTKFVGRDSHLYEVDWETNTYRSFQPLTNRWSLPVVLSAWIGRLMPPDLADWVPDN